MAPKQFQLDGPSLDGLKTRILAEHGTRARIVTAEKVRAGGVWGFFAREHYEVTVEVPERTRRGAHVLVETPARAGIAALLSDAETAEAQIRKAETVPHVSTGSDDFARLMDELTFNVSPTPTPDSTPDPAPGQAPAAAHAAEESVPASGTDSATDRGTTAPAVGRATGRPSAPAVVPLSAVLPTGPGPLGGRGDLVVIVGRSQDALRVARSMATAAGHGEVRAGGAAVAEGIERVEDRLSAMAARAQGVATGEATFVAFGLQDFGRDTSERIAPLTRIGADQLWVAVDAGRKEADTAMWVKAVAASLPVTAMAVLGCGATETPQTVLQLGLSVGWVDGATR